MSLSTKGQTRAEILQLLPATVQRFVNRVTLFQSSVAERLGINPIDLFALFLLRSGESKKPSELARALQVPSGTATKIVDRLEQRGIVIRSHDPSDRRGIILNVVPERIALIEEMYAGMAEHLNAVVQSASDGQLRFLLEFLNSSSEAAAEEQQQPHRV
jgi:DNA-binding MarR family transcriptional regulator